MSLYFSDREIERSSIGPIPFFFFEVNPAARLLAARLFLWKERGSRYWDFLFNVKTNGVLFPLDFGKHRHCFRPFFDFTVVTRIYMHGQIPNENPLKI